MNFDKLQSELKVTLLKLNDEIEKNTKIEEENIKLNDENIKLNQNFESIIKTLNQLQNDMIIVKKESKNKSEEIKRLNDDLNDKSEEIKRLNNVLNIQKEINTNLQKQINETEKEKLVEENKKLREDYDKILSFFEN
jgi:chromosome segregation ATPase